MMHDCKTETIKALLETTLSEKDKLYFIQSYVLGWTSEEQMQRMIRNNTKAEA